MPLRTRIYLTLAPLLALLAVLGGAGVALLFQLGGRVDAILRENYDSVRAMERLNEAVERIDSSFQFALAGKEDKARKDFDDSWKQFDDALHDEQRNITIVPDEPRLVKQLEQLRDRYRAQGQRFYHHRWFQRDRAGVYFDENDPDSLL